MELITPPSWLFTSTLFALAVSTFFNIWLLTERKTATAKTSEEPFNSTLSLPDGWWSDPGRFQDERRAVFSQVLSSSLALSCRFATH